jgi:Transposase DDE domain
MMRMIKAATTARRSLMNQSTAPRLRFQIFQLRRGRAAQPELGLDAVLPEAMVQPVLTEERATWRRVVYTPWLTFWAFFWQVLSPDRSCRAAVKRVAAGRARRGEPLDDEDTGPYCKARARRPEAVPFRLMRSLGGALHDRVPAEWTWCGRRVKVVDGTTVSMPDTAANQAEYPQSRSQRPGLGFPIARMVVVFCLATGAVLEAAVGQYRGKQTGENTLFRRLWDEYRPGDVSLGDRGFSSYFDLALLKRRGVDSVCRLHQARANDYRRGRRLGKEDHLVIWSKPARPDWMDEAEYDSIPDQLGVRIVRIRVAIRGFRTRVLDVVTTLLDADIYTKNDLADLYRRRWEAERHLRSIKVVLGLDVLRCRTPALVRKELWMGLLGYNVIRGLMVEAAKAHGRGPHRVSFKGALQTLQAYEPALREGTRSQRSWLWGILLESIARDEVGRRPNRAEPRARKRRPKPYPLLMVPRDEAKEALLNAG